VLLEGVPASFVQGRRRRRHREELFRLYTGNIADGLNRHLCLVKVTNFLNIYGLTILSMLESILSVTRFCFISTTTRRLLVERVGGVGVGVGSISFSRPGLSSDRRPRSRKTSLLFGRAKKERPPLGLDRTGERERPSESGLSKGLQIGEWIRHVHHTCISGRAFWVCVLVCYAFWMSFSVSKSHCVSTDSELNTPMGPSHSFLDMRFRCAFWSVMRFC
jgi:hypothetical protein